MAIFTHSYYGKGEAELNSVSAYFEDIQIVKATKNAGTSTKTLECSELISKGYVFSRWLDIGLCLALYVFLDRQNY